MRRVRPVLLLPVLVALLALSLVASACASDSSKKGEPWSSTGRIARDLPTDFAPAVENAVVVGDLCFTKLKDPRDGTMLTLARSEREYGVLRGDYEVSPVGKYGVGATDWLRIDCGTRRAIGIVRRGQ